MYFMHRKTGDSIIIDEEGYDRADVEQMRWEALVPRES